ncbi:hypothetical protein Hrd1104_10060 [Halorhabdus sp. CBA1104]|uniref:DUF5809 family protein n=1 Tax=Halorhabdus sp. CBA1104 TaxID=1380432 RepID=UPI0012B33B6A|nr:DUF5809 family protein [Halorhabdus sp. CBA1104]QGN07609.1 hypothetical protein Hrd1104_10060 [Halorhabdus sp. CBA1104]
METEGLFTPDTRDAARNRYAELRPVADVVVREVARAMDLSSEAFDRHVTETVVETAQDALFASMLEVTVGTRVEFETVCGKRDAELVQTGSENVDRVVWHAPPFADRIVATTFQDAREAAVGTLRRQAFGQLYRDILADPGDPDSDDRQEGE